MREKANAVEVGEDAAACVGGWRRGKRRIERIAVTIASCQLAYGETMDLRGAVAKLAVERLLERADVAILAEHERQNEPQVPRADSAVGAVISIEGTPGVACDVRGAPRPTDGARKIQRRCRVPDVVGRQALAAPNEPRRAPDQ